VFSFGAPPLRARARAGRRPDPRTSWRTAIENRSKAPRRILVADDDPSIRRMLGRALSAAYEVVILAADGDVALEEIRRHLPDLVLLDLHMPVLDGWHVLERLEAEHLDVPVILMSAEVRRPWPQSRLVRGRHDKGDGLNALLQACERALPGNPSGGADD
jgi:CheY-like chemotaxis protein